MPSTFAWLDTSERDRRRALDVIDLFRQKETVDELGIGSIRDAVADVLAPGTSTIQTRARYFFIPWIYQKVAASRAGAERPKQAARKLEIRLIDALKVANEPGTIGVLAGASLKRLPSSVYWAGLSTLGFYLPGRSIDSLHRSIERGQKPGTRDDTGDLALQTGVGATWHPSMPPAPKSFPEEARFALTRPEADFFREQLRLHASGSLFRLLIDDPKCDRNVDYPWELALPTNAPPSLHEWIRDAEMFSLGMQGAQTLYNLMLSRKRRNSEWIAAYEADFDGWAADIERLRDSLRHWDRRGFWNRVRRVNVALPLAAERFSEGWISGALEATDPRTLKSGDNATSLIADRERALKGPRARLFNDAQLAIWGGASGTARLAFRWGITRALTDDVVAGLGAN